MSLQVWLPLNGDLHNQGLDSTIFLKTTENVWGTGKIGEKALLTSTGTKKTMVNGLKNKQNFSIAFWVKVDATLNFTSWQDIWALEYTNSTGTGPIRFEHASTAGNCQLIVYKEKNVGENTNEYYGVRGAQNYSDNWYHITLTKNQDNTKCYINGNLTNTLFNNQYEASLGKLTGNVTIGASTCAAYLNDVRIYDHCLSPKEVEEIAKGLVLHYKLDNNGMGGENLLANSKLDGSWTYPSSSYSDKYSPITIKVPSGSVYTLSFEAKSTVNGDKIKTYYYSPNTTTTGISNQGVTKNAPDGNMDFTLTTAWKKYWVTYNQSSTTEVKHIICPRLFSGQGTGTVSVRNVKLEEGNKATAWSPALSDAIYPALYKTTIYDSSGYSNNGTIIGNLGIAAPSPRYDVATHLESSSPTTNNNTGLTYIQTAFRLTTPTQMTICWWGHPESGLGGNSNHAAWCTSASSSAPTDYDQTAFHHRDKRFDICLNSASSTSLSLTFNNYTLNEWHYYSVTYDGKIAILYKDGIETNRSTISSSEAPLKTFSYLYIGFSKAGGVYRKTLGSYSDFRIYATALSAQQIKELYTTSMQIDSSGNVFARELVEL